MEAIISREDFEKVQAIRNKRKRISPINDPLMFQEIFCADCGSRMHIIGEKAFFSCDSLTSINIPSSVTDIGEYVLGYKYEVEQYGTELKKDFTIHSKSGSTAEKYAEENNIPYIAE